MTLMSMSSEKRKVFASWKREKDVRGSVWSSCSESLWLHAAFSLPHDYSLSKSKLASPWTDIKQQKHAIHVEINNIFYSSIQLRKHFLLSGFSSNADLKFSNWLGDEIDELSGKPNTAAQQDIWKMFAICFKLMNEFVDVWRALEFVESLIAWVVFFVVVTSCISIDRLWALEVEVQFLLNHWKLQHVFHLDFEDFSRILHAFKPLAPTVSLYSNQPTNPPNLFEPHIKLTRSFPLFCISSKKFLLCLLINSYRTPHSLQSSTSRESIQS
jgi:hypothetical protein